MSDPAQLLVDHLDIWTGAIERKSGAGRGNGGKISLYGIDKLRSLILDLAVRGKLVPQDPADGDAVELLKRLQHRRPALIDLGLIRRSQPVQKFSGAVPFAIPKSWVWVRLDQVGAIVGGGTPPANDHTNFAEPGDGIPWLTPADLGGYRSRYISRGARDLTDKGLADGSAKLMPGGTVLFTSRAPIGYVAIASNPISTNQGFKSIVPFDSECSQFIALAMCTFADEINANAPGTTFKEVSGKIVGAIPFPLPPLSEQKRIVAKVDELMALVDALEAGTRAGMAAHETLVRELLATLVNSQDSDDLAQNWSRIEAHFDTLFATEDSIDALKQTVLELAVRGKLVGPQRGGSQGAHKLLKRISKHRSELVRLGKIRKERNKPYAEGMPPFELPENWLWVRIGEIALYTQYGTSQKSVEGLDGIPVLAMGNIQSGSVDTLSEKCISSESPELPELYLQSGDLLYNRTNSFELVGKTGLFRGPSDRFTFASYLIRIKLLPEATVPEFVNMVMNSKYFRETQVEPKITKQTGQANVNGTSMRSMFVPLPPMEDQVEIVKQYEHFVELIDNAFASLESSNRIRLRLSTVLALGVN